MTPCDKVKPSSLKTSALGVFVGDGDDAVEGLEVVAQAVIVRDSSDSKRRGLKWLC